MRLKFQPMHWILLWTQQINLCLCFTVVYVTCAQFHALSILIVCFLLLSSNQSKWYVSMMLNKHCFSALIALTCHTTKHSRSCLENWSVQLKKRTCLVLNSKATLNNNKRATTTREQQRMSCRRFAMVDCRNGSTMPSRCNIINI